MDKFEFEDDQNLPVSNSSDSVGADNIYDGSESRPGMKKAILFLCIVAAILLGVTAYWYFAMPHSAADQFERAARQEAKFLREKSLFSPEKLSDQATKVRRSWLDVYEKFTATDDQHISAIKRLAEFELALDDKENYRKWLGQIVEQFPEHKEAQPAADKIVESLIQQAAEADNPLGYYEQALKKCELFSKTFTADPSAQREFDLRGCRILDDSIAEPPIRVMRKLEAFLEKYSSGKYVDEILYRIGRRHQMINELALAEEMFTRIIEEFPDSDYLKKAEIQRAEVVGILDPERGEELWRELAEKYADDADINRRAERKADQLAEKAEQQRQDELAREANEARSEADSQRYGTGSGGGGGGGGPVDTSYGKPIPPREMLADFIAQQLNALSYDFDITITPNEHRMDVILSMRIVNEGADKADMLLMFSGDMMVDTLEMDSEPIGFSRPPKQADVLYVQFNQTWKHGTESEFVFKYSGTTEPLTQPSELSDETIESLGRSSRFKAIVLAGTQSDSEEEEDEKQHQGDDFGLMSDKEKFALQLNDSGYSVSPASWYPVTILGDLFTAEIDCHMPEQYTIAFSGRREFFDITDGHANGKWVCDTPMFGLYFAYGIFQRFVREDVVGDVDITLLVSEDMAELADEYLDTASEILVFYSEKFGAYPYPKLDIIQVDLPPFLGGMGPAGMIFLHSLAMQKLDHAPVNLMAHEISHHWWGNLVPINLIDDRYSQWLSEGFATYSDAMFTQHSLGDEAFLERIREMGQLYLMATESTIELPITKTFMGQSPIYRQVVYEKGALVLHALRNLIGDEKFFKLLKDYAEGYAFTPSNIDDFVALASDSAGESLEWFFNEWLDLPGCPVYELEEWKMVTHGHIKDTDLEITISQPDRISAMPIEIFIYGPDDQVKIIRHKCDKRKNVIKTTIGFDDIEEVTLDEELKVIHRRSDRESAWQKQHVSLEAGF